MKNNNLKEIDGKKFRRQYFTGVIYAILCIMIFVSFVLTILNFMYGKNDIPQLLTDILTAVTVCFFLQIPFIIVAIINRFCFGKIVCVTNEHGMYHENGFIFWSDIARIEYEIGLPSRYNMYPCHALIYLKDKKTPIELTHAPMRFLKHAKRMNSDIKTNVSKDSKQQIGIFAIILAVAIPLILLFNK